ncbi:unnamed protein product [Linum tenue]|uniref:Uncharacterized protein n=1 Tax=Linum tenue TaxID=586396 RepID=A0AAV0Q3A6_9ROSI|nr:unnamed protein product [Linum tenue]
MSWGSGDVDLLLTKVVSRSSGKRSSENAGLKSPPRKWEKRDGKRHKTDGDEMLLCERIDARFSTIEARFDNFSQEFKVAMGDAASIGEELMGRVMKMENEFRAFRDEIGTAVKSIIEEVKPTIGDPLSREQPTESKKNDQKDAVDNVKASAAVLLSTE